LLLLNLVIVPVVLTVLTSLNVGPRGVSGVPTFQNYLNALTSPATWSVLGNTLIFAFGATAIAVSLGVAFAFLTERTDMPGRKMMFVIIPLTITIPGILYAIAMVLLLSPKIGLFNNIAMGLFGASGGLFTGWAGVGLTAPPFDSYSLMSMVVVEGLRGVAVVFLMTIGVFRNMDPSLQEAGQMARAPSRAGTRRITLGIMLPGILAAALYALTSSLETFEIPAIMGLPVNVNTLSTLIFLQVQTGKIAAAATIGVGFLIIAVAAVFLYGRQVRS